MNKANWTPLGSAMLLGVVLLIANPSAALAQDSGILSAPSAPPPTVFLDCQFRRGCNEDHVRTEIEFVRWVRDRQDSDVHVILTRQDTGGAGRRFSMDFVGQGELEGLDDALTFTTDGQEVEAEVMESLARTLRLGLMRYAVAMGMGEGLDVVFDTDAFADGAEAADDPGFEEGPAAEDPWNHWTFRVSLSGDMDVRETRTSNRLNPGFNADRVTQSWKLNFRTRMDLRRDRRDLADGREVRDDRNDWSLSALIVRSISPHVSAGLDAGFGNSVRRNRHARVQLNPAVEYNYYPYAQSTRRQLIAHYSMGLEHSSYMEETVFGALRETLPQHRVGMQYRAREEWGNAGVGVDANQYLHDRGFYSFGLSGDLNYRIVRGLELNLSASAASVNDNIHTPAADISDEDILLGRQSLPSSYEYELSLGLSYRWGSSFSNIVNTRFPRSVR